MQPLLESIDTNDIGLLSWVLAPTALESVSSLELCTKSVFQTVYKRYEAAGKSLKGNGCERSKHMVSIYVSYLISPTLLKKLEIRAERTEGQKCCYITFRDEQKKRDGICVVSIEQTKALYRRTPWKDFA